MVRNPVVADGAELFDQRHRYPYPKQLGTLSFGSVTKPSVKVVRVAGLSSSQLDRPFRHR